MQHIREAVLTIWKSYRVLVSILALTLLFIGTCLIRASAQSPVTQLSADALIQRLRTVCSDAGSDMEHGRYHFVFAFNTSHFGEDAIQANVMRSVVTSVAEKLMIQGDACSIASWDMSVWDYRNPITLRGSSEAEIATEILPLPTAPRHDSHGGHDTERSVVDLVEKLKTGPNSGRDCIVVMLVNEEHSQMPESPSATDKLIGSDAVSYQEALKLFNRFPREVLTYQVKKGAIGNQPLQRKIDAVILLPKQLSANPLELGTRSLWHKEHLKNVGTSPVRSALAILVALIALALLAFFALKVLPMFKGGKRISSVQIGERNLLLSNDGQITRLIGPRFGGMQNGDTQIGKEGDGTPPALLGKLELIKNKIVVTTEGDLQLSGLQGEGVRMELGAGEHDLTLSGNVQTNPDLPPDRFKTPTRIVIA